MCRTKTARISRSKAAVLLLVILYLGIFTAHDLVFLQSESLPVVADEPDSPSYSRVVLPDGSIQDVNEHYCPFCSGFVDSHTRIDLESSSSAITGVIDTPEEVVTSLIITHNNPRDPPFLAA